MGAIARFLLKTELICRNILLFALLFISSSASAWEYSENVDKMRGTVTKYASTQSKQLSIFLRVYKSGDDKSNAYLYIMNTGALRAFSCMRTCVASIKFDDDPITEVHTGTSNDLQTLFIRPSDTFIEKLKKSRKLIIETTFVSRGTYQLEFDVSGLTWPH